MSIPSPLDNSCASSSCSGVSNPATADTADIAPKGFFFTRSNKPLDCPAAVLAALNANLSFAKSATVFVNGLAFELKKPKPLTYLESHAGRGLYDLTSRESAKTGEAEAGITLALKAGWFEPAHPYLRALQNCAPCMGRMPIQARP